jgi:L-amino acid N-acyltransferase YncA
MIRPVKISDAEAICNIYNYYIANSICTFETEAVSVTEMQERITSYTKDGIWIVFDSGSLNNVGEKEKELDKDKDKEDGDILGYAYAKPWHQRLAYRFTFETSVYLSNDINQKGIGTKLYQSLFDEIKSTECHTLLALISLPNSSSVKLHEKFGFEKVAHLKEVGYKFDKWINVGFWQLEISISKQVKKYLTQMTQVSQNNNRK